MKKRIQAIFFLVVWIWCSGCAHNSQPELAETGNTTIPIEYSITTTAEPEILEADPTVGKPEPTVPSSPLDDRVVQAELERIAVSYGTIGMQVAVIDNSTVAGAYSCGWATVDNDSMTNDHKIRIASISKVVVGMAAMLMAEDGIIDLDESIGTYWGITVKNPSYPNDPVSIRTILNHTSSIDALSNDYSTDFSSVLSRLPNCFSNLRPGSISSWYYNNYAFRLLGMTLELAAGQSLDEYLDKKIFSVIDIDAAFASGDIDTPELLATLYRNSGAVAWSKEDLQAFHASDIPGGDGNYFAGGLTISAADLAKLFALLAADGNYNGNQLMQAGSVEAMETYDPHILQDGTCQANPLVCAPGLYGRNELYFHTGSAYGVNSCASYDPTTGDGVIVLTTGADTETADLYGISCICDEINAYIYNLTQ